MYMEALLPCIEVVLTFQTSKAFKHLCSLDGKLGCIALITCGC